MDGIATGIKQLDSTFNGLKIGKLYCISATSSLERSSLIAKLALGVATRGYGILLCSMERSETSMQSFLYEIYNYYCEYDDNLPVSKKRELSMQELGTLPIWIEDFPTLSYSSLLDSLQKICYLNRHAIDLVIIDNIARMDTDFHVQSKNLCIEANLYLLKMIAKEYKVPVVTFFELNRLSLEMKPFGESKFIDKIAIFRSSRDEMPIFNRRGVKIIPLEDNLELSIFDEYKRIHVTKI